MNTEVIKSYLVEIGFDLDGKGFQEAQKAFGKLEQALNVLYKKLSESGAFQNFKKHFQQAMSAIEKRIMESPIVGTILGWIKDIVLSMGGLVTTVLGAIAVILAALTAATAVFMSKMAAADMEVQKLAMSLFTTTQNARSLKAVMDSMGVKSIEELRAVAMNPELRKQFLDLRRTAAGLEGGADVQQGFRNIRSAGNEMNRLGVIMNYFWQNLGGKLGHTLSGPLKAFEEFMGTFNKLMVDNMPAITDTIAGIFAVGGIVVEAIFKILTILAKITSLFNWVGKLISIGVELLYGTFSGRLGASVGKAVLNSVMGGQGGNNNPTGTNQPVPTGNGKGGINTHGLDLGNTRDFLKRLGPNLPGMFHVTSAKENRGHGPRSHASGNKFDLGFNGKSVDDIIKTMFALQNTPGFVYGGLEGAGHMLAGTRIANILQRFKKMGGDVGKFGDYTSGRTTGPHVDVLTKPIEVSVVINGSIKDKETADYFGNQIGEKFRTAMSIRNNTGSFA